MDAESNASSSTVIFVMRNTAVPNGAIPGFPLGCEIDVATDLTLARSSYWQSGNLSFPATLDGNTANLTLSPLTTDSMMLSGGYLPPATLELNSNGTCYEGVLDLYGIVYSVAVGESAFPQTAEVGAIEAAAAAISAVAASAVAASVGASVAASVGASVGVSCNRRRSVSARWLHERKQSCSPAAVHSPIS